MVELHGDWNYGVNFLDFDKNNYCIDRPKKYDAIFPKKK